MTAGSLHRLRSSEGSGSASGSACGIVPGSGFTSATISGNTISVSGQPGSSLTMSRRRSPVPARKDPGVGDMGTPHLPRQDPVSAQVSEDDAVAVSSSIVGMHAEEEVLFLFYSL